MVGFLTACSPPVETVTFEGKTVPATSIVEAETLGQNFIDVMCSVINESTITEEYVNDLQQVANNYGKTPPVVNDYENDWLLFPEMEKAINDRVEALKPLIGSPVDEANKKAVEEQCLFIQDALNMAFQDFNNME